MNIYMLAVYTNESYQNQLTDQFSDVTLTVRFISVFFKWFLDSYDFSNSFCFSDNYWIFAWALSGSFRTGITK